jgi:hypothetical protein
MNDVTTHMKNAHAVILGRRGGKAGTGASKARTRERAQKAVAARWAKNFVGRTNRAELKGSNQS